MIMSNFMWKLNYWFNPEWQHKRDLIKNIQVARDSFDFIKPIIFCSDSDIATSETNFPNKYFIKNEQQPKRENTIPLSDSV